MLGLCTAIVRGLRGPSGNGGRPTPARPTYRCHEPSWKALRHARVNNIRSNDGCYDIEVEVYLFVAKMCSEWPIKV